MTNWQLIKNIWQFAKPFRGTLSIFFVFSEYYKELVKHQLTNK